MFPYFSKLVLLGFSRKLWVGTGEWQSGTPPPPSKNPGDAPANMIPSELGTIDKPGSETVDCCLVIWTRQYGIAGRP